MKPLLDLRPEGHLSLRNEVADIHAMDALLFIVRKANLLGIHLDPMSTFAQWEKTLLDSEVHVTPGSLTPALDRITRESERDALVWTLRGVVTLGMP